MDKQIAQSGLLLEDFTPPVNPPKTIDDPKDSKPEDWDEREVYYYFLYCCIFLLILFFQKIPDPDSQKPDDWDESQVS